MVPATLRGHRGNQAPSPRPSCRDRAHRRVVAPSLSGPPPLRLHLHRRRVVSVGRVAGPPGPGVTLHDVPSAPPRVHRRLRGRRLGGRRRHRSSPPLAGLGSGRLCGSSTRRPPPGGPTPGGAGSVTDPWRNRIIGSGTETPDDLLANPDNCGDNIPTWILLPSAMAPDPRSASSAAAKVATTPEVSAGLTTGRSTTPGVSNRSTSRRGRIGSVDSMRCPRTDAGSGPGRSTRRGTASSMPADAGWPIGGLGSRSMARSRRVSISITPAITATRPARERRTARTGAASIPLTSIQSLGRRTCVAPLTPTAGVLRPPTASGATHSLATTSSSLVGESGVGPARSSGSRSSISDGRQH